LSIRELIKSSKTSALIDQIEQNLTYIKNNIDKITTSRQQNMSEIRQQREIFPDQIRQIHVKINSHLDTLEQNILQKLLGTPPPSLPLPQWLYFLGRFIGLMHTL
jgi:septation ring formation regulator EzrA